MFLKDTEWEGGGHSLSSSPLTNRARGVGGGTPCSLPLR